MSKNAKVYEQELDFEDELDEDDEFDPEDYIFVVTPSGDIKTVIFPTSDEIGYSKKVLEIFKMFGIDNPDSLITKPTLH